MECEGEREGGREERRERGRGGGKHQCERKINWLLNLQPEHVP